MSDQKPVITKDPIDQFLRVDSVKAFNIKKEAGQTCDRPGARITGCLFPDELAPKEIRLSHDPGARLRCRNDQRVNKP